MNNKSINFDWSVLPKEADKYIAMDENNNWNSFSEKPIKLKSAPACWICVFGNKWNIDKEKRPKNLVYDWSKSLFMNPKYMTVSDIINQKEEQFIEEVLELVKDKTSSDYKAKGYGNRQNFWNARVKKRCSIKTLMSILDFAGYELTFKKRSS